VTRAQASPEGLRELLGLLRALLKLGLIGLPSVTHHLSPTRPTGIFVHMIETRVQIPDDLFQRAHQMATAREWSFDEVVRRGLEHMTAVHPTGRVPGHEWKLPGPYNLGPFLAPEEQWTELCHGD
jgi:hypothetical protein